MTVGPDLGPRVRLVHKRIVLRHTAIVVQTQCFAAERVELLRDLAARRVSGRDVKLPVWSKANTTTRVKLRGGNVLNDHFTIDKAVRCFAITRYPHFVSRVRIRKINEMITAELRMQRHAHEPTLDRKSTRLNSS